MWPFTKSAESRSTVENPKVPLTGNNLEAAFSLFGREENFTDEPVTTETALAVPSIWCAVNFISGTIASLPFKVYRDVEDEDREEAKDSPAYDILHKSPNPEWTSHGLRKYLMSQVLTGGRGLLYIERDRSGRLAALWPMDPTHTTVRLVAGRRIYTYTPPGGTPISYQATEVIDIPFLLAADQVTHYSPIEKLKNTVGMARAMQRYGARFFKGDAVPPLALIGTMQTEEGAIRAGEAVLRALKTASAQGRKVLPLPMGHELKQIGYNPKDGQMIDGFRFNVEEVARMYMLPPVFLQDLTRGTFSNTEQQDLHFVKHTLQHWLSLIEQEFNLKLFRGTNRFCEFEVDGLLRGDFKTRMEGMSNAIQNSIMTPNEARGRINLPPKEGGDELVIQQNMSKMEQLGEEPEDPAGGMTGMPPSYPGPGGSEDE